METPQCLKDQKVSNAIATDLHKITQEFGRLTIHTHTHKNTNHCSFLSKVSDLQNFTIVVHTMFYIEKFVFLAENNTNPLKTAFFTFLRVSWNLSPYSKVAAINTHIPQKTFLNPILVGPLVAF